MKKWMVVIIEVGMLLGIIAAAFTLPRNTPLLTFGLISAAVFVLGNIFLIRRLRQIRSGEVQPLAHPRKRRFSVAIVLIAIYWLMYFLMRKR